MSVRSKRYAPAWGIFILSLLLLPFLTSIEGGEPLENLPDLAIIDFTMVATKDGYEGYLKIRNIGRSSSSDEVLVQVLDEESGKNSNRTDVVTFPLSKLDEDKDFPKEFKWEPLVPGTHILRAIVDINGVEKEGSKFNNVMSMMVTLPSLRSVTSECDGTPDPAVFGKFISGIENMVDLEFTYDDIDDPSLLRIYATVPGLFLEYGTMISGNSFRTSFDAGSLPAGEHEMVINSFYGGQPLSSKSYRIIVVERPDWYDDLERSQSFYDRDLSSYVFKGRIDIPPHFFTPEVQGIGEIEQISVFENDDELFLSGYVLLDGTTTYIAECDTELVTADGRIIIHGTGKSFARSPSEEVDISLFGKEQTQFDLAKLALGRQIDMEGPYGDRIRIPIPSLPMTGTVSCGTILHINGSGETSDIDVDIDIGLQGNTVDMMDLMLPGYDAPRIVVSIEADWSTSMEGRVGDTWIEDSVIEIRTDASITDLGLSRGDVESGWEVFNNGVGLDIAMDPDGNTGRLELSVKDGHLTHLIYYDDDSESEVYVNNTYKSRPNLEYLWDSRPLVVWAEAGYMEDRDERASSIGMKYSIGDINGNFSDRPRQLFPSNGTDQHPALASDQSNERTAIAWSRDMDGNISTSGDGEIFIAFYDISGWSTPQRLTEDSLDDRLPDLWFDPEGRLHLLWMTGAFSVRYASWSEGSGWSIPITLDIENSPRIDHVSFIEGDRKDPYTLLVTSSDGDPYRLGILPISGETTDMTTIISTDHYISSPSVFEGYQGIWNALWREWDGRGGDLAMASNSDALLSRKWSEPLRLTSDHNLELSPRIYLNNEGSFTLGTIPLAHSNGNASVTSLPVFTDQNLSWGAEAISLDMEPGPGSSPGTLIRATVLVEYRGMTPAGRVRVDISRVLRDKQTGNLTQEPWDSEMVEFTMIGQTQQVEFTVPVKEFQYGLLATTGPALKGIPAHSTQKFSSLPALPDLEILKMNILRSDQKEPTASVDLTVKNWGVVSSGPRTIVIHTSRPTAPLMFENGSFEPLFLREREIFGELNSTVIDIPAGGTISMKMNISLSPGMNHLWSTIEGPGWLPVPESSGYLTVGSFPRLEMTVENIGRTRDKNALIHMNVTVRNEGPWPLNVSYLPRDPLSGYDLMEMPFNYSVNMKTILSENSSRHVTLTEDRQGIEGLDPGESAEYNWTISPLGLIGMMEVGIDLSDGTSLMSCGSEDDYRIFKVVITSDPKLRFEDIVQSKVGASFSNSLIVRFVNPTSYTIDVVHITLFNGYPHDDVIVSEAIEVELGPDQREDVTLHFPLQEGHYIITATAEAAVIYEDGKEMTWLSIAHYETEMEIHDPGLPDKPVDDEIDMDDVTTAGIITISSAMFVLLVASFFYRREGGEEE